MKKSAFFCAASVVLFVALVALRLFRPPNHASADNDISRLRAQIDDLKGYASSSVEMKRNADAAKAALWTPSAVAALLADLPSGWTAQQLSAEAKGPVLVTRYAFSRNAAQLRDYPEFLRVLKKIEENPSSRIEAVTLVLNQDGQRFATALVTATLPQPNNPDKK